MVSEINLLDAYPKIIRPIKEIDRSQESNRLSARKFGKNYFDGDRKFGYGGYCYDGRWIPIAKRFIEFYDLKDGSRVLDVGCAKGFLLYDIKQLNPKIEVYGIDISEYAIEHSKTEIKSHCKVGNVININASREYFDLVICINVIHNLSMSECKRAIKEIERVGKNKYIQVDSWTNEIQHENLLNWQLTVKTFLDIPGWKKLFDECEYTGQYFWTLTT